MKMAALKKNCAGLKRRPMSVDAYFGPCEGRPNADFDLSSAKFRGRARPAKWQLSWVKLG